MMKYKQNPCVQRNKTVKFNRDVQSLTSSKLPNDSTTDIIRSIWQKYDSQGNGYLTRHEAEHFCKTYFKYSQPEGVSELSEHVFHRWFETLDSDGDDQISIVEMANYLTVLVQRMK